MSSSINRIPGKILLITWACICNLSYAKNDRRRRSIGVWQFLWFQEIMCVSFLLCFDIIEQQQQQQAIVKLRLDSHIHENSRDFTTTVLAIFFFYMHASGCVFGWPLLFSIWTGHKARDPRGGTPQNPISILRRLIDVFLHVDSEFLWSPVGSREIVGLFSI